MAGAKSNYPMLIISDKIHQCTNCQRNIPAGEQINTRDQAALNAGHALCLTCKPAPVEDAPIIAVPVEVEAPAQVAYRAPVKTAPKGKRK